ncbi:MAG TPA: hypothetical protein VII50_06535 [Acidothermaceae bacterium]
MPTDDLARITRPFGDVGVDFEPPGAGTTTLHYRLEVIVKRPPIDPTLSPPSDAYGAAVSALVDSYRKLAVGTEPHVARVTLDRFRQGPLVLPAAVLNALPKGGSYTLYLVSGGDMSHCPFDFDSSQIQGDFPIADVIT